MIYVHSLKSLNMDGQLCPDGVALQVICKLPCGEQPASTGAGLLERS